ncbi:MAG TPA: CBS domain-containing protein [Longimicrobiales bacterium]|nr:CBS domain-containing protein [Longimicrobiales bacterium]
MKMTEILRTKGHDVVTIAETCSVLEAIGVLVRHNIGALVVTDRERPTGIFTERDVLRLAARSPNALSTIQVAGVMTRDPVTAAPEDELHAIMGVMTERKIRHLPVVEQGELVGIVSIGDLLNACRSVAEEENSHLRQYIQGMG